MCTKAKPGKSCEMPRHRICSEKKGRRDLMVCCGEAKPENRNSEETGVGEIMLVMPRMQPMQVCALPCSAYRPGSGSPICSHDEPTKA